MKVLQLSDLPLLIESSSVTVGGFDGFHKGHVFILNELINGARRRGEPSILVTFKIPPRIVLTGEPDSLLMTPEEKIETAKDFGLDYLLLLDFTDELREMGAFEFLHTILIEGLKARRIVLGFNHHFGRNREGDIHFLANHLEEFGFVLTVIPPIKINGRTVSSSLVRQLLREGKVEDARSCLGRPYSIRGRVVKGQGIGERIGYRTANLQVDPLKLIPSDGVYVVKVIVKNGTYGGVMNIGRRPTVDGQRRSVEVHLIDYNGELYGCTLNVEILKRLRGEKKFDDLDSLRRQIEHDIEEAKRCLSLNPSMPRGIS